MKKRLIELEYKYKKAKKQSLILFFVTMIE